MNLFELIIISIGLGMDAFAVSVCKGLTNKKINIKKIITIASYFGIFQAIMPLIGYLIGINFENQVKQIDHWIIFVLLTIIGLKMIKESQTKDTCKIDEKINIKTMIMLSIATSIDALAVGITLAFLNVELIPAILTIGTITFLMCTIGVKIGNIFGNKYEKNAQIIGGTILILIGIKILAEHIELI